MSTATVSPTPNAGSFLSRGRRAFHDWRGQRPFWAGLLTMLGGVPIMYFPYANMQFGDLTIRMATTAGAGSLVIGVLLVTLGLTMWFQPLTRVFAGVATLVLVLVSLVVSNFGGLVIGFLLGLFGGGMSIAWAPGRPEDEHRHTTVGEDDRPDEIGVPAPHQPARRAGTGSALAGFDASEHASGHHHVQDQGKGNDRAA
ncbi:MULTISPECIES: DUF6114 domain-containing protein [unclassified Streptomyces]|uniref:DUF6114 domain-containing protein n=1 Tax=unclassified Streptomyces TaxID=2593676 RepID=UPI001C613D7A|nr:MULTISPECIES: DUF6114 domain-containing protein [unclassified Streptomyces]